MFEDSRVGEIVGAWTDRVVSLSTPTRLNLEGNHGDGVDAWTAISSASASIPHEATDVNSRSAVVAAGPADSMAAGPANSMCVSVRSVVFTTRGQNAPM